VKIVDQKVTLVDSMGSDLSVVNAARVSFDKESDWEYVVEIAIDYQDEVQKLSEKDQKLIKYLAKHQHWSPFSHATASFRVKAPIFVARQLAKHQVGFSWNEVSRRYVDSEPEFFIPDFWRERAENVKQGSSTKAVPFIQDPAKTSSAAALETYKYMLNLGVCPEQARMVLPQNTMTEWIWTGSLYGWARMCKLRLDPHTQFETQYIAKRISSEMRNLFPVSWNVLMEC
jgi:thymidylate synthase (FAD)